jgi:hypothetical protein
MGPERRPPSGASGGAEPPGSALGDDERTPVDDERTPVDDVLALDPPRSSRGADGRAASALKIADWLGSLDARSAARTAAVRDALAVHGVGLPESRAPLSRGEDDVTPVDDRATAFDELIDHDTDETEPPPAR